MIDIIERLRESIIADAYAAGRLSGALAERIINERHEAADELERLRASNKQLRVALEAAQDMAINAREPFGSPRFVSNNDPRWVQIADALEYAALKDAQGDKT